MEVVPFKGLTTKRKERKIALIPMRSSILLTFGYLNEIYFVNSYRAERKKKHIFAENFHSGILSHIERYNY